MNDFLPSRNVIAFVLIPALTIVGVWATIKYYQAPVEKKVLTKEEEIQVAIAQGQAEFLERDSDSDGLKDWEELLYKTEPSIKDTDGDGITDGKEVLAGSDPLRVGDSTTGSTSTTTNVGINYYKNDTTLSKTEVLARDLLVTYTELGKADALGNQAIQDSVINQLVKETTKVQSVFKLDNDDIKVVADSRFAAQTYYSNFTRATRRLSTIQFHELELLARYVENGDADAIKQLAFQADLYEIVANELATIPVPISVSGVHLELVNNLYIFIDSIRGMAKIDDDPLGGYIFAQKFKEDETLIQQNIAAISLYFKANGL